jgi:hypothetical protein
MKTLLGVLLLSLTALCTCSDTQAIQTTEVKALQDCQGEQIRCLENGMTHSTEVSVKDIPPVGCAIPMAQIEKISQQQY